MVERDTSEIQEMAERYERRKLIDSTRYARLNHEILLSMQERQRALVSLLKQRGINDLSSASILEIGCGAGGNLLELLQFGASPENLVGNELLEDRICEAAHRLPSEIRLLPGDASKLPIGEETFDIVYQSTVFTSLLDPHFQDQLAKCMWRWVKPGGAVLWYDFIYDNPSNPDVKGVPIKRVRELFPGASIAMRRVTLAPPISRRACRLHPSAYNLFNAIPLLRTHVLCWIGKPDGGL